MISESEYFGFASLIVYSATNFEYCLLMSLSKSQKKYLDNIL